MSRIDEPLRERQTIRRRIVRQREQKRGDAGRDFPAWLIVLATFEEERIARLRLILHDHHAAEGRQQRRLRLKLFDFVIKRLSGDGGVGRPAPSAVFLRQRDQLRLQVANPLLQLLLLSRLFRRRQPQFGSRVLLLAAVDPLFRQLIEVREELIELALRERVVLVVVALSTPGRQPHPDGGGRADSVGDVFDAVLLRDDAGLFGDHVVAVEAGRDALLDRRVRQQVACELLDGELIEGHVRVEGVDDPISPAPHEPLVVREVAVRVGVASLIEPVAGLMLAVARRSE